MQTKLDPNFLDFLFQLGYRMPPIIVQEKLNILENMLICYESNCNPLNNIVYAPFPHLNSRSKDILGILKWVSLAPKNASIGEINSICIQNFFCEFREYYSFDETIDASE